MVRTPPALEEEEEALSGQRLGSRVPQGTCQRWLRPPQPSMDRSQACTLCNPMLVCISPGFRTHSSGELQPAWGHSDLLPAGCRASLQHPAQRGPVQPLNGAERAAAATGLESGETRSPLGPREGAHSPCSLTSTSNCLGARSSPEMHASLRSWMKDLLLH